MRTSADARVRTEPRPRRGSCRITVLAAALTSVLALTGCLKEGAMSGGDSSEASAGSVPADATKQEYIAALEDLEPQIIKIQSVSSPGKGASRAIEAYAQDLEQWSGGKLSVKIVYGNAVASPTEVPEALAEGRLDMDYVYPLYEPSRFPKNSAFANIAFVGDHTPVAGMIGAWAGLMQAGLKEKELAQEFEEKGIKMLLPFAPNTSVGLMCREPKTTLSDFDGAQVRISGGVQQKQAEALKASAVSLPYSEQYQALQRGTIDCAATSLYATASLGLAELAPNYTTGSGTGLARVAAPYVFGLPKWKSLPLPYRQLIYDRMVTWVEVLIEDVLLKDTKAQLEKIVSKNGTIQGLAPRANTALQEKNQKLLSQLGDGGVFQQTNLAENSADAVEKWQKIAVEMGFTNASFSQWAKTGDLSSIDVAPFVERFWKTVASQHRPK